MVVQSAHTAKNSLEDEWDNLPKIPDDLYEYLKQQYRLFMQKDTLTAKIFESNAPYDNPYQSNRPRWLFVCSVGLLRSPTAAHVASCDFNANARSCGSSVNYALIPISVNLILWAEKIFFINKENYAETCMLFEGTGYEHDIEPKKVILDIPDEFYAYDPILIGMLQHELQKYAK